MEPHLRRISSRCHVRMHASLPSSKWKGLVKNCQSHGNSLPLMRLLLSWAEVCDHRLEFIGRWQALWSQVLRSQEFWSQTCLDGGLDKLTWYMYIKSIWHPQNRFPLCAITNGAHPREEGGRSLGCLGHFLGLDAARSWLPLCWWESSPSPSKHNSYVDGKPRRHLLSRTHICLYWLELFVALTS